MHFCERVQWFQIYWYVFIEDVQLKENTIEAVDGNNEIIWRCKTLQEFYHSLSVTSEAKICLLRREKINLFSQVDGWEG